MIKSFIKQLGMPCFYRLLAAVFLVLYIAAPAMAASYTYDQWHRLSSVLYDNGKKIDFKYDAAGNLLRILVTAGNIGDSSQEWPAKTNVSADRVWIIQFSAPVDASLINEQNIYVTDNGNNRINGVTVKAGGDGGSAEVHPPASGWAKGKTYFLNISNNIRSSAGKRLSRSVIMQFTTVVN
jgi:hypothetical protein